MPSPRMTLAALAFALACSCPNSRSLSSRPRTRCPKPNIDPGRSSQEAGCRQRR